MPIESSSLSYPSVRAAELSGTSEKSAASAANQKTAAPRDEVILSAQTVKVSSAQAGRKIEEIYKHKVNEDYASDEYAVDFKDYFSVDDLSGLSDEQKRKIKEVIKEAVAVDKKVSEYRNTPEQYAQSFAQMKMKLDFIALHVVPDSFKEQMLAANTKFIGDKTDQFNQAMENFEQSVHTWAVHQSGPSAQKLMRSSAQELEALRSGSSAIQTMQTKYLKAADKVTESDSDQFVVNFKSALRSGADVQSDNLNQYAESTVSNNKYIGFLTDDWNALISSIGDFEQYLVPTTDHPLIDRQV
ncbi:hypothetical protein M3N64_12735 [Sporolactobacillus sp. CPB3-1]|uniref:LXG domain-containing protein n=1 Tax=Sporolactobacillus mangiferae TaxID=2940498 RepID=A0ABT0MD44_9BACL|nr:hypothetical protein [Sporolactobacillus mangiferae]MCL1632787.1 hypothetical protein [Sporolactobacillus mangiferae]